MKQLCPILLFLFSCWNIANGQATSSTNEKDPYFIETTEIRSSHGPHTITRNLLQAKDGTVWFATWQGIMGYDGKTFTNYTLKENLIHFHVFYIFEDRKGNVWFCTVRGGVYKYDGKSFTLFTTKDGLNDNTVNSMAEDPNGGIWFGTWAGANRYDGKTFTSFKKNEGLCDNWVNTILADRTGKIWFGTNDGIYIFDDKSGFSNFTNQEAVPFKNVRSLLEDKEGKIWIGSAGGLLHYNGKVFSDTLLRYSVNYLCEDHHGNIWLSAVQPNTPVNTAILYRYDQTTFNRIVEKHEPGDWQIFGIIEDKDNNIWFGTMKGVCRFDVSRENHPCVKYICDHNLSNLKSLKDHQRELLKTFQYFN
jgi:ligand-binding sensor domain-containing protein